MFVFIRIQKKIQHWHFIENRHAKFQPAVILQLWKQIPEVRNQLWAIVKNKPTHQTSPLRKWQKDPWLHRNKKQANKQTKKPNQTNKTPNKTLQEENSSSAIFLWEPNMGKTTHFSYTGSEKQESCFCYIFHINLFPSEIFWGKQAIEDFYPKLYSSGKFQAT